MADTIHITGDTVELAVLLPPDVDWITTTGSNTPSKLISDGTPTLTGFEPDDVSIETPAGKTLLLEDTDTERFYDVDGIWLVISTVKYSITIPESTTKTVHTRSFEITTDADVTALIESWSVAGDQNKQWKVEATGSRTITFQLGDMLPDTKYNLLVDGAKVSDAISNGSGVVTFSAYTGSFSEKAFETEKNPFVPRVMIF